MSGASRVAHCRPSCSNGIGRAFRGTENTVDGEASLLELGRGAKEPTLLCESNCRKRDALLLRRVDRLDADVGVVREAFLIEDRDTKRRNADVCVAIFGDRRGGGVRSIVSKHNKK